MNSNSIGTRREHTLHAALKLTYEPDPQHHEIPCKGYIADILREGEIIEIQTKDLGNLRKKLSAFLPEYPVTVVHPIACRKKIHTVDETTGEEISCRMSPKTGRFSDAARELYAIKMYLGDPNLTVHLLMVDVDEYRRTDRRHKESRKGLVRIEQVPSQIREKAVLKEPDSYRKALLPDGLPPLFTTEDVRIRGKCRDASALMNVLNAIGAVERVGKQGRRYLYRVAAVSDPTETKESDPDSR